MGIELRLLQQVIDEYGRGGFTFGAQASMRQEDAEMMDAQQQQPGEQHQADARWQFFPSCSNSPAFGVCCVTPASALWFPGASCILWMSLLAYTSLQSRLTTHTCCVHTVGVP